MKALHEKAKQYGEWKFYFLIGICLTIIIFLIFELPTVIFQVTKPQQTTEKKVVTRLHVDGNILRNGKGQQVLLHGVNRSGTEYECVKGTNKIFDGPSDTDSVLAMKSWKIDAVRIPLNEDCWLGINGANLSGKEYQEAITNYVNLITHNSMYVILDLHWSAPGGEKAIGLKPMADKDHSLSLWTSVAKNFKNNPDVIFDLYNEPRNISWSCWKDGTGCTTSYEVASMQDMIDAVRATGSDNVVMLSGLDFANDLSGWLDYMPHDPLNNMAASFHMYGKNKCDNKHCWDKTIAPVIAKVPLIAGEFGESFNNSVCGTTTSNEFLEWMDMHQSSYLAWTWNTWSDNCKNLSLIIDYSGTPKDPNGTNYKSHLDEF